MAKSDDRMGAEKTGAVVMAKSDDSGGKGRKSMIGGLGTGLVMLLEIKRRERKSKSRSSLVGVDQEEGN
ncbi:hypothetical protein M0R45_001567 [Rubus argutus]|uniref:Uncharacterized protein n=1 Tax=Rubus argutus TaxID=59490 RepID=A0AAW1VGR5_RUBAR